MSTSRSPTPPSTKRLLQELKSIVHDPSPILEILRPASEAEILHWEAVMKGFPGTAYEGISPLCLHPTFNPHSRIPPLTQPPLPSLSRSLAPRHPHPALLPSRPAQNHLLNAHLPPECRFQDWRNLPRSSEDVVVACVHAHVYVGGYPSVARVPGSGQSVQRGYSDVVKEWG